MCLGAVGCSQAGSKLPVVVAYYVKLSGKNKPNSLGKGSIARKQARRVRY